MKPKALLRLFGLAFGIAFAAGSSAGTCPGRIPNPLTDVCWSCTALITIAGTASVSGSGSLPDVKTDARGLCACGSGLNTHAGINLGFWEPLRTAEIVRHSGCFPSLGGVKLDLSGIRAADHARTPRGFRETRRTAFWQVHWYQSPWLFTFDGFFIVRVGILVFGGTQSPAVRIHFVQLHVLIIRLDKQHLKTPDATENQNREQKEVHPHSVLQFFGFSTHASNL